jgi:hypothetical protein
MKALSFQQPWAQLIAAGIKDVANCTFDTSYRGRVLIYANSRKIPDYFNATVPIDWANTITNHITMGNIPDFPDLPTSAIIGYVDIVDVKDDTDSYWDEGGETKKWIFKNAQLFTKPVWKVKSKLQFFDYDIDESNLSSAFPVKLKKVSINSHILTFPISVFDYEAFKEVKVVELYATEELADMLCEDDTYDINTKLFNRVLVKHGDEEELYDVEDYDTCCVTDGNDNPIKIDYGDGDEDYIYTFDIKLK